MNSDQSRLTVVIPYYNREKYLPSLLDSLSSQRGMNSRVKLIFVDNNSTDSSHEIVNAWVKNKMPSAFTALHLSENRQGAAAARNAALTFVETEWLMFFDSDDLMPPYHLSEVLAAIENNPDDVNLLYWDIVLTDTEGKKDRKSIGTPLSTLDIVIRGAWSTQRIAMTKHLLLEAGGWNDEIFGWNDWELSVRLLLNRARAAYVPLCSPVIVNLHGNSITGETFTQGEGKWEKALAEARKKALKTKAYDSLVKLIDLKTIILSAEYARENNISASRKLIDLLKSYHRLTLTERICFLWNKWIHKGVSYIIIFLHPKLCKKLY